MAMRKLLLLPAAVLALTVGAAAYEVPNLGTSDSQPFDGMNTAPQDQADMLNALGLFQGTPQGYQLDRSMNRSEAAAMLVRLLGQEEAALREAPDHPFTDVPEWADPYVGWLWENDLTRGVSATAYGASRAVTAEQYLMFLNRVLYGGDVADDYWKTGWGGDLREFQQSLDQAGFLRRDAVSLSALALCLPTADGQSLAQRLLADGAIDGEAFLTAAPKVYESLWGTDQNGVPCRSTAGVLQYGTAKGLTYVTSSNLGPAGYFLTTGPDGLQAVDCETLETVGKPMALRSDEPVWFWESNDDWLMVQQEGETETVLYQFDWKTGKALAQFVLPHTEESPFPGENGQKQLLQRSIYNETNGYYWGGAGLYRVENGVLRCLQERRVSDLLVLDDGGIYVLTYTPGHPIDQGPFAEPYYQPGNEILYRSPGGAWETVLGADSGHGIDITALVEPDEQGKVGFRCGKINKYQDDTMVYRLVRGGTSPSIRVESVYLMYPETVMPIEQVPDYQKILVEKEQQRLNALGIGV